jgi:hypothetical protein
MTTRLFYLEQIIDLLNFDQMTDRKKKSAIDAMLNLIHDIELALKKKKVITCIFLNVKVAFNYVSSK